MKLRLKWWWYILPAYLTIWSIGFSLWNIFDGYGMMAAFGIDSNGTSSFIMLNSAARYVAIALNMIVGIWIFSTYHSILTALLTRLTMDLLDLYAGYEAGILEGITAVIQPFIMFIGPGIISILLLIRYKNSYEDIS